MADLDVEARIAGLEELVLSNLSGLNEAALTMSVALREALRGGPVTPELQHGLETLPGKLQKSLETLNERLRLHNAV